MYFFIFRGASIQSILLIYTFICIFSLILQNQNQCPSFQNNSLFINKKNHINISSFPIDIVYTWVDGRDQKWLNEYSKAKEKCKISFSKKDFMNRYVDIEEMRYSLRSVEKNAPWINNIFIVTWDQKPNWINSYHPKIKFISHSQIFPSNVTLPTFNSNSIDFLLYRIPGLSEHFIYVNDDMYFGRPVSSSDFFTPDGKSKVISKSTYWSRVESYNYELKNREKFVKNGDYQFNAIVTNTILEFKKKYHHIFPFSYSHIPFPLTKKICEEAYINFKEKIELTLHKPFRTTDDLQMQPLMLQYGLYTNQSIAIDKNYNDIVFIAMKTDKSNMIHLTNILKNKPKLLSINIDEYINRDAVKGFLNFMFRDFSCFELPDKPPIVKEEQQKFWAKKYDRVLKQKALRC